ncbi:hypothetical protein FACS1894152_1300 [Bacilli bacterium]|nr:hypothetical protein FACS1894152_1300 [Bacilli bacterium]
MKNSCFCALTVVLGLLLCCGESSATIGKREAVAVVTIKSVERFILELGRATVTAFLKIVRGGFKTWVYSYTGTVFDQIYDNTYPKNNSKAESRGYVATISKAAVSAFPAYIASAGIGYATGIDGDTTAFERKIKCIQTVFSYPVYFIVSKLNNEYVLPLLDKLNPINDTGTQKAINIVKDIIDGAVANLGYLAMEESIRALAFSPSVLGVAGAPKDEVDAITKKSLDKGSSLLLPATVATVATVATSGSIWNIGAMAYDDSELHKRIFPGEAQLKMDTAKFDDYNITMGCSNEKCYKLDNELAAVSKSQTGSNTKPVFKNIAGSIFSTIFEDGIDFIIRQMK